MPTPASSEGGGTFNGGTITNPLIVAIPLITDPSGPLKASYGTTTMLDLTQGAVDLQPTTGGHANLADGTGAVMVSVVTGRVYLGANSEWGSLPNARGQWFTASHLAPADADLSNGDCALWFDQTNGAAKLMVKAKETGGTVRTAAIALA